MKKIIVHGVHRSGTSLCSSLLEKSGLWFAEKEFQMPAQADNPEGFWERLDVTDLNDEILFSQGITWFTLLAKIEQQKLTHLSDVFDDQIAEVSLRLESHDNWFLKDPRFSITWPLWKKHLGATDHLFVHRHPVSIAQSLKRRNNIPVSVGLAFWYHQTRMIASSLVNEKNVHHIDLFSKEQSVTDISALLNKVLKTDSNQFEIDNETLQSVVKPSLIHHQSDEGRILQSEDLSVIQEAWTFSRKGDFTQLLALPELKELKLSSNELSDTYSDLIQKTSSLIQKTSSLIQKTSSTNIQKTSSTNELIQEVADLKEQLVQTATFIRKYKYSPLGLFSSVLSKLKLVNHQPLDLAFNTAKQSFSADDVAELESQDSIRFLMLKAMVREPKTFIRKLTFGRILSGIKILANKSHQNPGARQALKAYGDVGIGGIPRVELFPISDDEKIIKELGFEKTSSPLVSIVIPVYNEYATTLSCLQSIKKHTNSDSIPYEIIIADDASSDETSKIGENIEGLRVVRSQGNLGFLENCNNAIKHIRGRYVLLLNNDTNVQSSWLSELLTALQSDESIGVVGPKFVYPDGRLQEAGGIVFSDANGWNYGRFDNPGLPEYNFVRDVDYISGACLLFSKKQWEKIGGFDTRFIPAYYEDTDFCFQVRDQGLRVVYIPTSVVVHFEGVSHGQDENSGVKQHQVENKAAFLEKWKDTLNKDHHLDSHSLFKARSYGKKQKTLVFIDHYIPHYDKDAGSKVAQRYIELMVQEGVRVIFIGDNFYPHQPYTKELQSIGVEVLYGKYYEKNWFTWFKENCHFIDTVYFNRPHITAKYIDKILTLEKVPYLAYHGADLHYLRVEREAKLGITDSQYSSDEWKKIEYDIMRKCNVSFWLSDLEVSLVKHEDAKICVEHKPMCWFEEKEIQTQPMIVEQSNLLFVGSFGHSPNLDGLMWFLDSVFPAIVKRNKSAVLTIIGSDCPDHVYALESENIRVLGYVSEEELALAYRQARISIVPLRYGAGVKGKVIESMRFGVPVLTTDIGAEGLPAEPCEYLSIANKAEDFIQELLVLLSDDALVSKKILKTDAVLRTEFSRKAAVTAVNKMFR